MSQKPSLKFGIKLVRLHKIFNSGPLCLPIFKKTSHLVSSTPATEPSGTPPNLL